MIIKTRTNFSPTISIDGIQEKDINNTQWSKLIINRPISYYKVRDGDTQRPDLISLRVYGNVHYFWPLMKFNLIDDIWNDISVGDIIKCPSALDMEQYFATIITHG